MSVRSIANSLNSKGLVITVIFNFSIKEHKLEGGAVEPCWGSRFDILLGYDFSLIPQLSTWEQAELRLKN